jgi:hypothetical protein
MTSVSKGNAFEDRVFNAISNELKSDGLGVSPRLAKSFKKKGYYSRDRETDIVVDIAIEVWLPNADQWSLLWVCECKDYTGTVPVNDVEEFKAKLDQIAGVNKKGVMAVSGPLQQGALKYARANGIGVIRLLPDDKVEHISYYMTAAQLRKSKNLNPTEFYEALTDSSFVGVNRNFYAEAEGYIYGSWFSILKNMLIT